MKRPINKIAAEISVLWWGYRKDPPKFVADSLPYLEAMFDVAWPSDTYGVETADDVVVKFLARARDWVGPDAERIKAELCAHLEDYRERNIL